jgi:hypothetical protein
MGPWVELAALYVAVPLIVYVLAARQSVPLVALTALIAAAIVLFLGLDPSFSWKRLFGTAIPTVQLVRILAMFLPLGGVIAAYAFMAMPQDFLALPRRRPDVWLAVMIFYPLVSVTAQEIMFRVFFLHRYGALFEGRLAFAVLLNAALFAFAHIVFASWITIFISFAGGLIFAWRYLTARSFWAVVLEHSLYGNLIFTVGLGRDFLAGVPFA